MNRLFALVFSLALWAIAFAQPTDCYTIAVGAKATVTGKVIVAHNEDDWGNLIVNLYRTPAGFFTEHYKDFVPDDPIFHVKPLSTLWFQVTKQKFGDVLVNQNGVVIWSDACPSREDTATGMLTFHLRRLVAEYAYSARRGVKVLGKLVETYGYNSSGRTYLIADANEAWLVSVVKGRRWVARRVPDSMVAIIPNYYTIDTINLDDTLNFYASPDIIQYAIDRGWYNPQTDGKFNFRKVYGAPKSLTADWNIPRHWGGMWLIARDKPSLNDQLPFAFVPKHKISAQDLQKVLSFHYEDTELAPDSTSLKNPHQAKPARICNAGTKISLVAQLHSNQPNDSLNLLFFAPLNPCIQPYLPISATISRIPSAYQNRPISEALEHHFDPQANTFESNPQAAYSVFFTVNQWVNQRYWSRHQLAKRQKIQVQDKTLRFWQKAKNKNAASYLILKRFYQKQKRLKKKLNR